MPEGSLRIGELARRTGASPAVLRAWEQRYGIIEPQRSPGGTRLYSERDEERIHTMQAHMADGLSAAQAARAALAGRAPRGSRSLGAADGPAASELDASARTLRSAWARLDRELAEQALDRLLASFTFETVASEVLLPYLADVGARWQRGEATIAEEHLATHILRARLLALTHGFGPARGARAVLACPPREQHDIALLMLAVALERRGWRVVLLGANTPVASIVQAADVLDADCVVVSITMPVEPSEIVDELKGLASSRLLLLAGPAANDRLAQQIEATVVASDPITAAAALEDQLTPERPRLAAEAVGSA
ncbi:MAG TPA: MerR family transcriptional regulator [Gaiellales bacterium]|nr:MerR family transcriptional regulator [Gaiellales bacterium]